MYMEMYSIEKPYKDLLKRKETVKVFYKNTIIQEVLPIEYFLI